MEQKLEFLGRSQIWNGSCSSWFIDKKCRAGYCNHIPKAVKLKTKWWWHLWPDLLHSHCSPKRWYISFKMLWFIPRHLLLDGPGCRTPSETLTVQTIWWWIIICGWVWMSVLFRKSFLHKQDINEWWMVKNYKDTKTSLKALGNFLNSSFLRGLLKAWYRVVITSVILYSSPLPPSSLLWTLEKHQW